MNSAGTTIAAALVCAGMAIADLPMPRGDPDRPDSDHWGGRFVRHHDGRPNWWVDDRDPAWQIADRPGARTVSQYREQFLRDWQQRMARLAPQ